MDKQAIEMKFREIILKRVKGLEPSMLKADTDFGTMGVDSLALSWIMADTEEAFNQPIRIEEAMKLRTLALIVDHMDKKLNG